MGVGRLYGAAIDGLGVGVIVADDVQLEADGREIVDGCVGAVITRCGDAIAGARKSVRGAVGLELLGRDASMRSGDCGAVGCATVRQVLTGDGAGTDMRLTPLNLLLLSKERPLASS